MRICAAAAVLLGLCGAQAAHAADAVPDRPPEAPQPVASWPASTFQVTPYLWVTGLEGRISPFRRGPTLHVDKSFSDVMDSLKLGGFINVWGRYDRAVFSGDVMYVDTTDIHATGTLKSLEIPEIGTIEPNASASAKVDSKVFNATLQGGYRFLDTPRFTLDALGGVRFWHVSNDVTVTVKAFGLSRSASHGESFGWTDPVVGLRAFLAVTDRLSLQAQADVGGFGVGSDLSWSALATVHYNLTDRFTASAGYKVLDVDYHHGGHVYDTRMNGPVLGLTMRF